MRGANFEIVGLDELGRKLAAIGKSVHGQAAADAVTAGAGVIVKHAQSNVRSVFTNPSGNLRNSIRVQRVEMTQNGAFSETAPSVVYGRIQELGGTVRPVRAKALRFQINGHWVSAKQVTIPARPYLRPAVEDHREEIVAEMREVLNGFITAEC